jgi:uroporphyrinogen decarboxylase
MKPSVLVEGPEGEPAAHPLRGLRVFSPESRHAAAIAEIITRLGGEAIVAPSMREIPLDDAPEAIRFAQVLRDGAVDAVIFLTGVGTGALLEAVAPVLPREQFVEALTKTIVVARGPKSAAALHAIGARVDVTVPEPNTWREIIVALDARGSLAGRRVAIQEYGATNQDLMCGLEARGAVVTRVPVYRWALPEDTAPLRRALRDLGGGRVDVAVFTNAVQVEHCLRVATEEGIDAAVRDAMPRTLVASVGPVCSEALQREGLEVDFEPAHPKMKPIVQEMAQVARELLEAKRRRAPRIPSAHVSLESSLPPRLPEVSRARLDRAPFMKACRREPVPYTPIWIMRQAGRYMREYREVRAKVGMIELCKRPDLVCEVTVTAAERLGVDAAIIFSDILLPLEPMGVRVEFAAGEGPVLDSPVRGGAGVDALREIEPESLGYVCDAIRLTRTALRPDTPLLGFAGAPFTLASYICEGGSSRNFEHTKMLMYRDAGVWHALLEKIVRGIAKFLNAQIAAGVQAVQIFDSWVGALGPDDYREFVLPHTRRLIESVTPGVPLIHFGTGTAALIELMRDAGGHVIGLDWRVDLAEAWARVGYDRGVQGNLDPLVLLAAPETIRARARRVLQAAEGRPGHIFNLGHGILPTTSVDHAIALVNAVHEESARG